MCFLCRTCVLLPRWFALWSRWASTVGCLLCLRVAPSDVGGGWSRHLQHFLSTLTDRITLRDFRGSVASASKNFNIPNICNNSPVPCVCAMLLVTLSFHQPPGAPFCYYPASRDLSTVNISYATNCLSVTNLQLFTQTLQSAELPG